MTNYWLIFESYVHISIKSNGCLFYNTLSSDFLLIEPKNEIFNFLERNKNEIHKNYIVSIELEKQKSSFKSKFIDQIRDKYIGDIIDKDLVKTKPFQIAPIVKDYHSLFSNIDIKKYLTSLFIYVNNECNVGCSECENIYKQFTFCKSDSSSCQELDYSVLESFLMSVDDVVNTTNILGGNILKYTKKEELFNYLDSKRKIVILHFHFTQLEEYFPFINKYNNIKCRILFNELDSKYSLPQWLIDDRFECIFLVKNEMDIESTEKFIKDNKILNFTIYPFYTGDNISFFEEIVYLNTSEILSANLSQDELITNELINRNNFGKMTIVPSADVYTNFNFPPIGNLSSSSALELIDSAMVKNKAWKLSRKDNEPCNNCKFEFLCPPPQNYEAIIKPNLCNIINNNGEAENQ